MKKTSLGDSLLRSRSNGALLDGGLSPAGGQAALAQLVDADRNDNDDADDDFLHECGPSHLVGTVAQDRHGESPNHGSQDAAAAAAQTGSANDNRRDDVQLQTNGHGGVALRQPRELHETGQAEKDSRDSIDQDF